MHNFAEEIQKWQPIGLSPLSKDKGGKSGQHRALHFLTESCLREQSNAEENNRLIHGVRVRRWGKSPPAVQRCTGRVSWRLQVHVNRRLRVARPSRRVERFSIVATWCIDEWQALDKSTEPGLQIDCQQKGLFSRRTVPILITKEQRKTSW